MKIHQIYIEKEIQDLPLVESILKKYPSIPTVIIDSYQEIFNRNKQNFRIQKETPCLILAKKFGKFVHKIPDKFGLGFDEHYYFSTVLNCPFDCQYCFLQGLNKSSHYVIFVNHEDFKDAIKKVALENKEKSICFFSGYDGDSLALDSLSNFATAFLPFFETLQNAKCEVRTKSIAIKPLLDLKTTKNTFVAYTLNPEEIIERDEKKTPRLHNRLDALKKLALAGYSIALRFDPILLIEDFYEIYGRFFHAVFHELDPKTIHSATIGTFRMPKTVFQNFKKIDPINPLLALLDEHEKEEFSYSPFAMSKALDFAESHLKTYLDPSKIFKMQ